MLKTEYAQDEDDPRDTILAILSRIEQGTTIEADAIWLRHFLLVKDARIERLQERIDMLEGLYRVGEF